MHVGGIHHGAPWEVAGDIYAMTIPEATVDEVTSCEVALLELAKGDARGTVSRNDKRSELELLMDSGAFAHVCPEDWGKQWPLEATESSRRRWQTASHLQCKGHAW